MLKHALLALLARQPRHGYELKRAFEELLGGTWEVNIGQVYATLARLERDGLVASRRVPQDALPDRKVYALTEAGREALRAWLGAPVQPPLKLKNEVILKALLALALGDGDLETFLRRQRQALLQTLARLTAALAVPDLEPTTALVLEGALLHLEADLRWLERLETYLKERGGDGDRP